MFFIIIPISILFFSSLYASFRFYVSIKYAKYLISDYKTICEIIRNDTEIDSFKSDLLTTEIISMDHSLDYINRSLVSNPFKMYYDLIQVKRGDK